jgi:hypothetical protein
LWRKSLPIRICSYAGGSMLLVEGWNTWELRWLK